MSCFNKCNSNACDCLGVIIAIVLGVVVGVLYAFFQIPIIIIGVWIAFGLGVLSLIFLVLGVYLGAVTAPNALSKCLCEHIVCLLVAIIGTIVSTIILLVSPLIPTLLSSIIFVAIAAFFFALLLIELIIFLECIVRKSCCMPL